MPRAAGRAGLAALPGQGVGRALGTGLRCCKAGFVRHRQSCVGCSHEGCIADSRRSGDGWRQGLPTLFSGFSQLHPSSLAHSRLHVSVCRLPATTTPLGRLGALSRSVCQDPSSRARPRSHPVKVQAVLVTPCCALNPAACQLLGAGLLPRGGSRLPTTSLGSPESGEPPLAFPSVPGDGLFPSALPSPSRCFTTAPT